MGFRKERKMTWIADEMTRRRMIQVSTMAGAGFFLARGGGCETEPKRTFHLCLSPQSIAEEPERVKVVQDAGVTDIWMGAFFYGHWYSHPDTLRACRDRLAKAGLRAHVVNVPLGHPGDSLGEKSGTFPLTPPERWRIAVRPDGSKYAGTSLHPPATEENAEALRRIQDIGISEVFLDDDFRLAVGPGTIGGCFCDRHREQFLKRGGYTAAKWNELLEDVSRRVLTPILRDWVEFTCDQLTESFREQQKAAPNLRLGNMVMYLGAEKAGIRLADYRDVPLRVGELMFDDNSFGKLNNKTNELFSSLFHRRFVSPELAYSETTAFPADKLSAKNMAAKLVISTISDVRNTMFMSGMTPFPLGHWEVLAPAMKKQAAEHERIAGHKPRGPFKHYWGEWSRYVSKDQPYSLFLATGIPFEVTETPAQEGWTFLSDSDAQAAAASDLRSSGTKFVIRPESGVAIDGAIPIAQDLTSLFAFKKEILPQLPEVPSVEDEKPVVCAWYPTARAVLLWNLSETKETFTVTFGSARREVEINGLDSGLLTDIG